VFFFFTTYDMYTCVHTKAMMGEKTCTQLT